MLFHECIPANRHVKRSVPPCWAGSFRMNAHAEKKVTAHQFGIDRTFGSWWLRGNLGSCKGSEGRM